jgi:hypothetical protein
MLKAAMQELPDDWDLFYLRGTPAKPPTKHSRLVSKCNGMWGTFAYLIRESVYDFVIQELRRKRLTADQVFIKIVGLINAYCANEKLVSHNVGYSYITHNHRQLTHLV